MKIRLMSDLHIEFFDFRPRDAPADVVVLAGDILNQHFGISWARKAFPANKIVYVMGNHEYYNARYEDVLDCAREEAERQDVHLLDRDVAVIDGVRFLGATLWTDFEIEHPRNDAAFSMWYANREMNDFRIIRHGEGRLRAEHTREFHREARTWLTAQLAESFEGPTVVVTHHLPHKRSIHPQFHRNPLNPAFASHLPELVRPPVRLWIHGHTHCSCDYEAFEGTRVVCNPRGYGPADLNERFSETLVVEV